MFFLMRSPDRCCTLFLAKKPGISTGSAPKKKCAAKKCAKKVCYPKTAMGAASRRLAHLAHFFALILLLHKKKKE
jgi:hypothetical protein